MNQCHRVGHRIVGGPSEQAPHRWRDPPHRSVHVLEGDDVAALLEQNPVALLGLHEGLRSREALCDVPPGDGQAVVDGDRSQIESPCTTIQGPVGEVVEHQGHTLGDDPAQSSEFRATQDAWIDVGDGLSDQILAGEAEEPTGRRIGFDETEVHDRVVPIPDGLHEYLGVKLGIQGGPQQLPLDLGRPVRPGDLVDIVPAEHRAGDVSLRVASRTSGGGDEPELAICGHHAHDHARNGLAVQHTARGSRRSPRDRVLPTDRPAHSRVGAADSSPMT